MLTKKIATILVFFAIATTIIRYTSPNLALEHDARSYYDTAVTMVEDKNILGSFFSSSSQFIDHGYPTFLATVMQITGTDSIVALQVANYLLWLASSWLIYRSLVLLGSKHAKWASVLMLFSPLYLTFSGKVYSEPFACLGTSLIIYSLVSMTKESNFYSKMALTVGGVILFSTKSVLLPFIIPLGIYLLYQHKFNYFLWLTIVPIILIPSIIGSMGGGRSLYTLNIQSSKVKQSYDQIFSCVPYYLSYPLGKALLPQYEGVCHQNDASPGMPGYESNPYVLADISRAAGFNYSDWLMRIIYNPVKYLLVMIVSLSNIVLFEGIYPSILLLLPFPLMLLGFGFCKIVLSFYLWVNVWKIIKENWILGFPILYFVLVVTNFPVEPRYFYPFIPYVYFLTGLGHTKASKL
jgi:hypothetical protein